MRRSVWLAAFLGIVAAACSSTSSTPAPANDAGGGGGGSGTCDAYGTTIAKNAPSCGGVPDAASAFRDSCQLAIDALKSCRTEYEALLSCQAKGARCEGGKIALGACDAETAAQARCEAPVPDAGADAAPAFSILGTWDGQRVQTGVGKVYDYRVVFSGTESMGKAAVTVKLYNVVTNCRAIAQIDATFAFTAPASSESLGTLDVPMPAAASEDVTGCDDPSGNGMGFAVDTDELARYRDDLGGDVNVQSPAEIVLSRGGEGRHTFKRQ